MCRTMIGKDRHGMGESKVGRGNIAPATIILPKLGLKHGIATGERKTADIEGFWEDFEKTLRITEDALVSRYELISGQSVKAAPFTYNNGTMAGLEPGAKTVESAMKHNTLAIGYIGVAEMCEALFGKNFVHDKEVYDFAISVVERISTYAQEASDRNDLNFSCYATPAESLCRTSATVLREQYGKLKNITDRAYITNSHHVPVWEDITAFEKVELEAPFCKFPTGGCITYVELDAGVVNNVDALESLVNFMMENDIPYGATNFPIDTCLDCGFTGEFNNNCVVCGSGNIEQLRRVTGYLTVDYRNFNEGKIAEVLDRKKHGRVYAENLKNKYGNE